MPRFSLSPARGGGGGGNGRSSGLLLSPDAEAEAIKYRESNTMATDEESSSYDDDEDSTSVSSSEGVSSSSDEDYEDDDDDEPPHPLGFPKSYGRTRFVVDPSDIDIEEYKSKRRIHDDWFDPADYEIHRPLSTTSISVGVREVGTSALLAHHHGRRHYGRSRIGAAAGDVDSLTSSMDRIAALVGAASYLGDRDDASAAVVPSSAARASAKLWKLAQAAEQQRREIAEQGRIERSKVIAEQERAASTLRKLIERDQKAADEIEEKERIERERAEEAERRRLEAEKAEEERLAQEEKARVEAEAARVEKQRRADEVAQRERAEEAEALAQQKAEVKAKLEAEAAEKTEHITKAKKLMDRLVEVRASLEPFESNKAVSKRRLQFKKVVRGRLNTLSHEADKIRAVSSDVVNAVNTARAEDEQIKSRLEETGALADGGLSPDMARGKRYLLDLLCSNVIVRVQAEGFNCTRGDGFPLAAVLTSISVEVKEFIPLLASHLYTACPATIPTLPDIADDASETALMDGLGMIKDKKGEYETFDRFLTRTEGLVSIIANIMAFGAPASSSSSSNNPFGGGSTSAPGSSPFNTGAATTNPSPFGQQSNNAFGGQPQQQPTNPFGAPSAQAPTPFGQPQMQQQQQASGSVFGGQQQSNPFGSTQPNSNNAFGAQSQTSSNPSPFGGGAGGGGFGGGGGAGAATSNPFGGGRGSSQSSSFGGGGGNKKPPCRFFAQGSCRYGANCKFSHDINTGGSNQNNNATSFGAFGGAAAAAPAPSPFGGGGGFGSATGGASPFGGGGLSNPFGGPRR